MVKPIFKINFILGGALYKYTQRGRSVLAGVLFTGLLTGLAAPGALAQLAPSPTNQVHTDNNFVSAGECKTCHVRQFDEWAGSMMRYSSISPPIHTLERAENEKDLDAIRPFQFPRQGLAQGAFGIPNQLDPGTGRFARSGVAGEGFREENNAFCQKCHAPVAVFTDILPAYEMYGGLEIDTHQVLQILSRDANFFDSRPTQAQVDARLANPTVIPASGDDAVTQRNALTAQEGVTCTVCHSMSGRTSDNTFADRRPNFEPGVANSAYLFEGFLTGNRTVFGPYNDVNFTGSNELENFVTPPRFSGAHNVAATELMAPGVGTSIMGNDGVQRSFLASGEMCGTCHDVRIPLPDTLVRAPNGDSEAFRRVENLFTEWRNSPWNNNNNAPDPQGTVVTSSTVLDNAIANPRQAAREVTSLAAINNPGNLTAAGLVQPDATDPIKQITTCQDCHMSKYMTDAAAQPGEYASGAISNFNSDTSTREVKITDHRFIGVDRILVDQSEYLNTPVGLADISELAGGRVDPNGFEYPQLSGGKTDAREVLLEKAVDFKIVAGAVEGPLNNRVLPIRISVENVGAGHNIPAGLSQERQVWIELQVLKPSRNSQGDVVIVGGEPVYINHYTSGYLVKEPGDFHPLARQLYEDSLCAQKEYECNLDDIYVELDKGLAVIGGRIEKRDLMGVDDNGSSGDDTAGDYNLRQVDPEIGLTKPRNLGLINYQNGFTRGMDSAVEGQGNPILELGSGPELRREKVFSQFIGDSIDNSNALKPFEKRIEKYDIPVTGSQGPFLVKARLRFRPLPPEFLKHLAENEGSRITSEVMKRNIIIEMSGDECIAGDPSDSAQGRAIRRCEPIATISAGGFSTCASVDGNTTQCWGQNQNSGIPQSIAGLTNVKTVTLGPKHGCALLNDGKAQCWGPGSFGQLGNGIKSDSAVPVEVILQSEEIITQLALGDSHSCVLLDTKEVMCWGRNTLGQLGRTGPSTTAPGLVDALLNERGEPNTLAITAGDHHTCALSEMGEVRCWGQGNLGVVGDDNVSNHNVFTPQLVKGLRYRATAIAASAQHTCALMASGDVKCWGNGNAGKLGNGDTSNTNVGVAQDVVGGINGKAVQLAVGRFHSCALVTTGNSVVTGLPVTTATEQQTQAVKCWGDGRLLGNGSNTNRATATDIAWTRDDVLAIDAGYYHTCMVLRSGDSYCWGTNFTRQINNDSSLGFVPTPVKVDIVPSVTYHAPRTRGGLGTSSCTANTSAPINCTQEPGENNSFSDDYIDLNEGTGYKWVVAGGTGGSARLTFTVASPGGTRSMSLWINDVRVPNANVSMSVTNGPRGTGAEVDLNGVLLPGENTVELRDTQNTMELDIFSLSVSPN